MICLIDIIILSTWKTRTVPVIYSFNKILKLFLHHLDLINSIPCKIDLTSTPFIYTTMITYEIELPPDGNKTGLNLLDNEYFKIHYVIDKIPNSPDGHQLPTQAKKNVLIVDINREDTIIYQGAIDELQCHHTRPGKSKFKISLCRSNLY